MKFPIAVGLNSLVLLCCFPGRPLVAAPTTALPAPQAVDTAKTSSLARHNFVSLWWCWDKNRYSEGFEGEPSQALFTVMGNIIRCELGTGEDRKEFLAGLSDVQIELLIAKLNKRQRNDDGKVHEDFPKILFTLKLSDENGRDKNEDFVFFAETAANNVELENYLRELEETKFSSLRLVAPDETPAP